VTSAEDRILDLSLEEVVGGRRPPDLLEPILERTRRPTRRLPLRPFAWAAAALLLVALAVWAALPPRQAPPTISGLTAEEESQVEAWIALQRETIEVDLADPAGLRRLKEQWLAQRRLLDLLDEKPAGWATVRSLLLPLPEGEAARDVRSRLIEILGRAPGAEEDPHLLDLVRSGSFEVEEGVLLVLAERDCAPARALLERRVATMPPVTPLALPAAYLALRGDGRGEATLRSFLTAPKSLEAMPGIALACAAGLRRLGDPDPWPATVTALGRQAQDALSRGDLDGARVVVAALTLVGPAVRDAAAVRLGDLDRRVERLARELRSELATAEAIAARLAELSD